VKTHLKYQLILLSTLSFFLSANAFAENSAKEKLSFGSEFRFFIEGAIHKGGDSTENIPLYDRSSGNLVGGVALTVVGNYGGSSADKTFAHSIDAGGFIRGSLGIEIPLSEQITLSTSVGYLYDQITGDLTNGSTGKGYASFSRIALDLIGFYNMGRHRIGLGGSYHYQTRFDYIEEGDNFRLHGAYDLSDNLGSVIQYDYLLTENSSMGLRYTNIFYDFEKVVIKNKPNNASNNFSRDCLTNCSDFIDASTVSLHLTFRF